MVAATVEWTKLIISITKPLQSHIAYLKPKNVPYRDQFKKGFLYKFNHRLHFDVNDLLIIGSHRNWLEWFYSQIEFIEQIPLKFIGASV